MFLLTCIKQTSVLKTVFVFLVAAFDRFYCSYFFLRQVIEKLERTQGTTPQSYDKAHTIEATQKMHKEQHCLCYVSFPLSAIGWSVDLIVTFPGNAHVYTLAKASGPVSQIFKLNPIFL